VHINKIIFVIVITLIYVVKLLALKEIACEEIFCVHVAHTTNNIVCYITFKYENIYTMIFMLQ